jgi:histidinol-phosphate aminotransferase
MTSITEKGGGSFKGTKVLVCENPLPPIEEAIVASQTQVPHRNYYTEPYSEPLRSYISESRSSEDEWYE